MSSPGLGYLVAFSGPMPRSRSPIGIQPPSPDQRTWMIFDSSGRSRRKAATVAGAASSSSRALKAKPLALNESTGGTLLSGDARDVGGDGVDLGLAQLGAEGRHGAETVLDPFADERGGWLCRVEV